jgi:prepilin-type processing-associated H-X9-DG protein
MQNEQKLGLLLGDKTRLGGPFREDVAVRPAEIVDGLFCTAFFSERRIGTSSNSTYVPNGKPFVDVARLPTTELLVDMGNPNRLSERCATIPLNFPTWSRTNAREWYSAVYSFYNHVLGPNANVADCGDATNVPIGVFSARSYHSNCVNTLFGDGHVEPISDSIDLEVMRGELPSQEQTTCNGNSRWSSVCLLARIEWNNRGQGETQARRRSRVISPRKLAFFQPIAVLAAARYWGAATTYSLLSPKISKASSRIVVLF